MKRVSVFLIVVALVVGFVCLFSAPGAQSPAPAQEGDIQLPDGYICELIYRPFLAGLGRIVRSEDGLVFITHLDISGGIRVSMLDVDQNQATTIFDLAPEEDATLIIIGGPEDTFFIDVGGEIRQVNPDGSFSVWGQRGNCIPWYYTPDGRMLGIAYGETGIVELFPDGSTTDLVTGLSLAYDVIADDAGNIFISDFMAEELIQLDSDAKQTTIASIPPDNTDLTLDGDGNLYINSVATGFARVDKSTGNFTPMTLENAPCAIVQSPADVVFDDSGRAIFASWAVAHLTWADFSTNTGGELLHQPWANSFPVDIGPDDALYVGVDGCGTIIPSEIVRFTVDGDSEVHLGGLSSRISDIAFDSSGGLYVGLTTENSTSIQYYPSGSAVPLPISVPLGYDIGSMETDPVDDSLLVSSLPGSPTEASVTILRFTIEGFQESYSVSLPKPALGFSLGADPEGALYAFAIERERFMTGPEVDRWILLLDLVGGTSEIIAQVNRIGCCPTGSFSVDSEGNIWWVLNPEFVLYKVSPPDTVELFAYNLPVDSGTVHRNSDGDLILNTPDGIYRIWESDAGRDNSTGFGCS